MELVTPPSCPSESASGVRLAPSSANPRVNVLRIPSWKSRLRGPTMLLRRAHLYAGLVMLPWVFLYGLTGLLFNHPTWFSDQSIIPFGAAETRGTPLEGLPSASQIAGRVVAAINARSGGGYRIHEPGEARFGRGGLTASVLAGGKPYTVSLDPDAGTGTIRAGATGRGGPRVGSPPPRPRAGRDGDPPGEKEGLPRGARGRADGTSRGSADGVETDDPLSELGEISIEATPLERLRRGLPDVLTRAGLPGASVSEVRASPLSFLVEGSGRRWRASYDLQSGAISGRPADEAPAGAELTTRRFLLRLHTAHGYPSEFNARWVWAVIVDVMSAIMIFWGLSGLVMWWQIKRTRRVGSAALIVSAVAATWVFVEMHAQLLNLGR